MKKYIKCFSLFLSIVVIGIFILPVSANAEANITSKDYIDLEVPFTQSVSSPLVGNASMFNAFFSPYQTETTTNMAVFDWRNVSLPSNAIVTKVEVSSIKTNVPGMTYYVQIGKSSAVDNFIWAPDI